MEKPQRNAFWQALNLAWELGYTVAIPLVVFALIGRWADNVFGTKPWLFLAGVLIAIISSSLLLVRTFSRLLREMNPPKNE